MTLFHKHTMLIVWSSLLVTSAAFAADWPQWRGPNRDGTSPETGLLKSWPEGGPPLEIKIEGLGDGITSVAVVGDRIFTLSDYEEQEYVVALDRATGERLWTTSIGPATRQHPLMRWLSQRTPTIDGERLYAITPDGRLVCLKTADGSLVWDKSYPDSYQAKRSHWGFCDYPLVDGERLICTPGGEDASVVALNKTTGEEIWQTLLPTHPQGAHSATLKGVLDGKAFYVTFLHDGHYGLSAEDGRMLWRYEGVSARVGNTHTPLLFEKHLLATNGYGGGMALLKLEVSETGIDAKEIYKKRMTFSPFQDNNIAAGENTCFIHFRGSPVCVDILSGDFLWGPESALRTKGYAVMTFADGSLYTRSRDGLIQLINIEQDGGRLAGQFELPEAIQQYGATSPVISLGRLYIRDNDRLFCYDIRKTAKDNPPSEPKLVNLPPLNVQTPAREPRVPHPVYVPTPHDVVARMLKEAGVDKDTTLVDLGSGDGRIVIAAAKEYGAKAVGYEIEEELVGISRSAIAEQKLEKLARIESSDMYKADLSGVDVVAVFLYPEVLEKLKPQFAKLKAGTRIVSHQFPIPGVKPEKDLKTMSEESGQEHRILLYKLPLQETED